MKRLVIGLLSVVALAFAVPAIANPPVEEPILDVFTDINPCSGEEMTVTFVGSVLVHEHERGDRAALPGTLRVRARPGDGHRQGRSRRADLLRALSLGNEGRPGFVPEVSRI
jgi:hypothetical protein